MPDSANARPATNGIVCSAFDLIMDHPFEPFPPGTADEGADTPSPATIEDTSDTQFRCYICDEPSTEICVRCTRDACENHLCEKCQRCSDCCACEETLH